MGKLQLKYTHKLLCGDSTNSELVNKFIAGNRFDISFTSPPYNAGNAGCDLSDLKVKRSKYKNNDDNKSKEDYLKFLLEFSNICMSISDYTFVNIQMLANTRLTIVEYMNEYKDKLKDILIWNKNICPPNIGKGAFNTKFEFVLCFSDDNKTRCFPCLWQGQFPNVIECQANSENKFASIHKAGFPVAFPLWFLEKFDFCRTVYEPFCGTGTTLIACEKTNRICYGCEIDPSYCDIILSRYEKYSGKKVYKLQE